LPRNFSLCLIVIASLSLQLLPIDAAHRITKILKEGEQPKLLSFIKYSDFSGKLC
jgi:hypothetical protein